MPIFMKSSRLVCGHLGGKNSISARELFLLCVISKSDFRFRLNFVFSKSGELVTMDALITWDDMTINVVSACDLECLGEKQEFLKGQKVRILWRKKYYYIARKKKNEAKEDNDQQKTVATFDLQQVIMLPKTNDNQVFYRRGLANFTFTIYELKTKVYHCFTWHEGQGKRGSSEISTCVRIFLENFNIAGSREVILFSDGCLGQNKNSILPAMLLHSVSCLENIDKINLLYFEPSHGQNEGDSVHSAISTAIEQVGDIYVPSQLIPIFHLARRKSPCIVHTLQTPDILDFKTLSRDMRILSIRTDDQGIDWTTLKEIMGKKTEKDKIFFKCRHQEESCRSITLMQRFQCGHKLRIPAVLYLAPPKISKLKYKDLMSLCRGTFPVIRVSDYVKFY